MKLKVDLSNRLEEAGPTFLAFSNSTAHTIKIPAKVKQAGIAELASRRTPKRQIKPLLWAGCIFLLLKHYLDRLNKEVSQVIIDNEFDGHQVLIKSALLRYIWRYQRHFPEHKIVIRSIGKKSPAHKVAWQARRRKRLLIKLFAPRSF
jgi:hypothetical protein